LWRAWLTAHPFDLDLPIVNGRTVPYVDTMIAIHGDHAHALQSPIFPVPSAPLIALFGVRGAYILPLVSFVALLPLLEALRRRLSPQTSPALLAGIAAIIGIHRWPAFAAGIAAILVPFAVANGVHSGDLFGPHAGANLTPLRSEWLSHRVAFGGEWLWPTSAPAALVVVMLVASVAITRLAYRELRGTKDNFELVVAETRAKSKTGDVVVSGAWWYEVVAALYGTRVFLYMPSLSASDPRITALGCADGPSDTIGYSTVSFETLRCDP